eukprot:1255515-Rhodomonas_salina.1
MECEYHKKASGARNEGARREGVGNRTHRRARPRVAADSVAKRATELSVGFLRHPDRVLRLRQSLCVLFFHVRILLLARAGEQRV